jgi:hypothetical protein
MPMINNPLPLKFSPLLVVGLGLITGLVHGVLWSESSPAAKADTPASEGNSPLATRGPKPKPIVPPPPQAIDDAIKQGVVLLLADQRPDGSWGSPEGTKGLNIYAPPPGAHDAFRTAVTSLVVWALIDATDHLPRELQVEANKAIDGGEKSLAERLITLRRATPDALYNIWAHAYSIQALARLHRQAKGDVARQERLRNLAAGQVDMLRRYSFINGGWSYYDFVARTQQPAGSPMSFTTATVLIALRDAREMLEIEFPEKLIDKAIASLKRQQKPDFSYAYGEYLRLVPMHPINRPGGSLGRSQVCNLALRLYGDERVTDEVLATWLNRLIARNGWLGLARKRPIPHDSDFYVAGYFYYYGHFYAAMCIDELPNDRRPFFQEQLANIILSLQEQDGSWWDFPLYNYHKQYGTAMAIMTLVRCR